MNITDKTVLITGANRGIGRALVQEALERGAKRVYAAARGALDVAGQRVTRVALDVTDASQIAQAADAIEALDLLINNAGIATYGDFRNFDEIFPDPSSQSIADGWHTGVARALERQFRVFVPENTAQAA